uniref:Uncharacterized protein n=1 Tax=Anguilla anguilla TaxID=7936 RepID=A0A0E9T2T6_ANGAN
MLKTSRSTSSQRYSIRLTSGDCAGHCNKLKSVWSNNK